MKKRILFVIDSLACAGAEKSLVSLLNLLDYQKYDVDLQLFAYGGEFEKYLPEEVNLLPAFQYTDFSSYSLKENIGMVLKNCRNIRMLLARIRFSLSLRMHKRLFAPAIARFYWQKVSGCIEQNPRHYDVAIAYAQGVPTFYVVDKVNADKKMSWVNVSYHLSGEEQKFQSRFYHSMDRIVMVSESALSVFKSVYPDLSGRMRMIKDIIDARFICKLAEEGKGFDDGYKGPRILTVARLNYYQKGYDIALQACKILKDRGLNFRWYALGRGNYEPVMREYIKENHLESYFILLGTTANPYPYFKNSTLYVQTSRHEGFGLSIAEARLLNIPVVTTEFDAVYVQMVPGKNGLVVPQNPEKVADAIVRILENRGLYDEIVTYQKNEKKGNTEELEKFYNLISE